MADFDMSNLPEALVEVMKSPEIAEIMKSLSPIMNKETVGKAAKAPEEAPAVQTEAVESASAHLEEPPRDEPKESPQFNLSGDMMSALPGVLSALSMSKPPNPSSQPQSKDRQRKALLYALRPYLSPKRRRVVDGMIGLEGLSGMFGAFMENGGKN